MNLPLFQALRSIRIDNRQATAVVDALDKQLAASDQTTNTRLDTKLDALRAELSAQAKVIEALDKRLSWYAASATSLMALAALTAGFAGKLLH